MGVVINHVSPKTNKRISTREAIVQLLGQFPQLPRRVIIENLTPLGYTVGSINKALEREKKKPYPLFFSYRRGIYELTNSQITTSQLTHRGVNVVKFDLFPNQPYFHNLTGRGEIRSTFPSRTKITTGERHRIPLEEIDISLKPKKGEKKKYLKILIQKTSMQFWISNKRPGYTGHELMKVIRYLERLLYQNGMVVDLWFDMFEIRNQQNVKVWDLRGMIEVPYIENELILRIYPEEDILNTELRYHGTITVDEMLNVALNAKTNVQVLESVDRITSNIGDRWKNFTRAINGLAQFLRESSKLQHEATVESIANSRGVVENVANEIIKVQESVTELHDEIALATQKIENEVIGMVQNQGSVVDVVAKSFNALNDKIGKITTTPPSKSENQTQSIINFSNRELEIANMIITTLSESAGLTKNQVIKKIRASRSTKLKVLNQLIRGGIITVVQSGQKQHCFFNQKEDNLR